MVYPGRYEEAVVIDKDLDLIGSGPQVTIIYSSSNGITVNTGRKTTILGFTITSANIGISLGPSCNSTIRNNVIVGNGDHGIQFDSADTTTVTNNLISYNAKTGIMSSGYLWSNTYIHNNIISNNGSYGLFLNNGIETISYNNVYSNASGNYTYCSAGTGDISLNPEFIDYASGNFALKSTSPCINVGRPGSADADPDGTRNDMGAYGGPDAASFWPYPPGAPIITSLTATPTSVPQGSPITINATGEIQ